MPETAPEPTKIRLDHAEGGARYVRNQLGLEDCLVAGSIRRRVPWVKDIELVCAMPGPGEPDTLLQRIRDIFVCPVEVAAAPSLWTSLAPASDITMPAKSIGVGIKGVREEFRYCQLRVQAPSDKAVWMNVDIFRYDPGPQGNRGWIELIRTGPADFSKNALIRWKKLTQGKSDQGYPITADGRRVPVPSEEAAFALLEWPWIHPWNRQ